jgi:hypothetical protein
MPKLNDKEISTRLQEIFTEKRPKSERAFALAINADPSYFAKVMKAERPIPESMLDGLASAFQVNREWLLFGKGKKYVQNVPRENISESSIHDYRDELISSLKRENARLQKDLDLSLGELRHNILLTRAMSETTQEMLVEYQAGKNRKRFEELIDTVSTKNVERYKTLKEEAILVTWASNAWAGFVRTRFHRRLIFISISEVRALRLPNRQVAVEQSEDNVFSKILLKIVVIII